VICGLNRIRPKKGALTLLNAREILTGREHPLLVVDSSPARRAAAFATDLAPHWCGGLLDWGRKRIRLRVRDRIWVEAGEYYVQFVSNLLRWLAGSEPYLFSRGIKGA